MARISGLSVKVSAATAQFRAGMGRAEDAAQDLSLSLQRLSFSSERAESNIDEVGRAGAKATGGMTAFTAGTEGASFSVRGLSVSIIGALIPALITLSATLVPIVAALGGFIAIAGAIAGIGLVGTLGAIATNGEQLKERLLELLDTAKEVFAPAFDLATEVLFIFMETFEEVLPALLPAQDVLQELAGNFAQLGVELINMLPAFVDLATTLALEFLPPFVTWVQDVLPQVPGFIQSLVGAFRRMLPMFLEAGRLMRELGPPLLEFGFTALNVVGPALAKLTTVFIDVLTTINSFDQGVQSAIAQLSLVSPILVGLVSILGGVTAPVLAVVGVIVGLAAAWKTNFGDIRGTTERVAGTFQRVLGDRLPTLITELKELWTTIRPVVEPVFKFLTQFLGVALVNLVDVALGGFTALLQFLNGDFQAGFSTLEDVFFGVLNRTAELINKFTGGVLEDLANDVIGVINTIGSSLSEFADFIGEGDRFNFESFAEIDIGTTPFEQPSQPPSGPTEGGGGGAASPTVEVQVKGDTGVVEDVAATVVDQEGRQTRRQQGAQQSPTR